MPAGDYAPAGKVGDAAMARRSASVAVNGLSGAEASSGSNVPVDSPFRAAAGSCATGTREPSQGREAAALSGPFRVPQSSLVAAPSGESRHIRRDARAAESARLESV